MSGPEEYTCHSIAIRKYSKVPHTFADFLTHINNPDAVKDLFTRFKLTVIYFINDGSTRYGEYFYYSNVTTLMNQTECAISLNPDSADYQHVFVLIRNETNLLESTLQLLTTQSSRSRLVIPETMITSDEYLEFNKIASELPSL